MQHGQTPWEMACPAYGVGVHLRDETGDYGEELQQRQPQDVGALSRPLSHKPVQATASQHR